MRRKKHPQHANHERWLVSYADFITLLFAFFVVMFASAQSDKAKVSQVSASVREALEKGQFSDALNSVLGHRKPLPNEDGRYDPNGHKSPPPPPPTDKPPKDDAPRPDLAKSLVVLNEKLADELKTGKMQVKLEERGLIISLREAEFFASGDDVMSPSSFPTLDKVAGVVKALPNPVRLEGHTDSQPIHTSRFRSNWDLSAARGIAVLDLFEKRYEIPRERMAIAGYAETAPADTNETEEGRAHNRRVDVVVLARSAAAAEPNAGGAAGAHAAP